MCNIMLPHCFTDNRTAVTVWNRGVDPDGEYTEICGKAGPASDAQMPGDLKVSFPTGNIESISTVYTSLRYHKHELVLLSNF
jgi:lipocalin